MKNISIIKDIFGREITASIKQIEEDVLCMRIRLKSQEEDGE